jgi:hypothetical protein
LEDGAPLESVDKWVEEFKENKILSDGGNEPIIESGETEPVLVSGDEVKDLNPSP